MTPASHALAAVTWRFLVRLQDRVPRCRGKAISLHARLRVGLTVCVVSSSPYSSISRQHWRCIFAPGSLLGGLLFIAMVQPATAQPAPAAAAGPALSCGQANSNYQAVNGAPVREPRSVELAWRDVQRVCGAASSAEPPPQQYVGPASTDPRPVAPMAPKAPVTPTGSDLSQQRSPLK
jgi:hypothetical protein